MKAVVDQEMCIGCGLCCEMCDAVFRMNEQDKAETFRETDAENPTKYYLSQWIADTGQPSMALCTLSKFSASVSLNVSALSLSLIHIFAPHPSHASLQACPLW